MTSTETAIEYDLCIAYAAGDAGATGQLRDWSAKLVRTLEMRLSPPPYAQDPAFPKPKSYCPESGALDWEALRAASARSTLLFVIVSPAFCNAPGAAGVVKAFLEANAARGGTADSIMAITALPLPGDYSGDAVMMRFVSLGEERRADFYDETKKEPIEYALGPAGKGSFVLLLQPILEVANEIRDKLKALRSLGFRATGAPATASDAPAGPAPGAQTPERAPPVTLPGQPPIAGPAMAEAGAPAEAESDRSAGPVITAQLYLRDYDDATAWDQTRTAFSRVAIVSPELFTPDPPGTNLTERLATRDTRVNALITCNAMALVRATPGDKLLAAAKAALWDLNLIRQKSDPAFAWMLADWVGDPPPALPEGLSPPRVFPRSPDFAKQVQAVIIQR